MMNKKELPHIITAVSFVIFIVLGLACASTPNQWEDVKYNGEDSRLLEGTSWLWVQNDKGKKFEFHPNGKLVVPDWGDLPSWERVGTDVKLVGWKGYYYFEGKLDLDNFTISGTQTDTNGKKWDFTLELASSINGGQRYVNGFDTALYGRWTTDYYDSEKYDKNEIVGYTFFAGNFVTYIITDRKRESGSGRKSSDKLEKGTYTTDDKGTLTFKVTHTYDRTEKIFLSKDEFTARQKAQGKTTAQINDAIKEYFPDRSVKYSIGSIAVFGWKEALEIKENISRNGSFMR